MFNNTPLTDSQKMLIIQNRVIEQESDIQTLNKVVLLGNGELPLREQVRNHQKFVDEVRYWTKLVIGLFIAQFIAFTAASFIAYVKFLPVLERLADQP
jgi:hypothetical protein